MSRVIKDDEEYARAESAKFKLAAELDKPLSSLTPEERARKLAIYDRTVALMKKYDHGRMVQEFPGLREKYNLLGWEFQEFDTVESEPITDPPAEPEPNTPTEPEKRLEPPQEPKSNKPKPDLSAWF
ncbi:hypothetical protein EJP82_01030 [Paenibacillus anaericanus]|uniref:Uncharacterized protein n=1 Tax=Paenibacillus anaericanus TaxID=170367 RepID=A0A3S1DVV9_9BACL|nr:hypothetical protein [Paenibacillus anaericanus]RUT48557.1 hypothetical protein EJP82_01030 [Paenibacillus anaericanus]